MDFETPLKRANLEAIESYLLYGGECLQPPTAKPFADRLAEAQTKATGFFQSHYTDIKEYDEISGYFYELAAIFKEVYFEAGLLTGAKLAYHIRGKMEELK